MIPNYVGMVQGSKESYLINSILLKTEICRVRKHGSSLLFLFTEARGCFQQWQSKVFWLGIGIIKCSREVGTQITILAFLSIEELVVCSICLPSCHCTNFNCLLSCTYQSFCRRHSLYISFFQSVHLVRVLLSAFWLGC